ncbi:MAG: hypothetical protein WAM14_12720 [Candidatus Nitrosopolaris sp.]
MKTSYETKGRPLLWSLFGLFAFEILLSATVLNSFSGYAISSKALNVIITSPEKGQQVPVSKNLIISGISSANVTNCEVSVIINNIKPYQKATATGHNGSNDYSTWVYRLGFPYPPLKLGENKITAKITCAANNHARFNTVNVTGVQQQGQIPLSIHVANGTNGSSIKGG